MILNRWAYIFIGIVVFMGLLAARKYFILETTGSVANEGSISSSGSSPSIAPSDVPANGDNFSAGSVPSSLTSGQSSFNNLPQTAPQAQNSFSTATGNSLAQPAMGADPTTLQHNAFSGGRVDIEQIGQITVSQQQAYTGDDITFTVTIKNTAAYKKFVRQLCWQSTEGNFGCSPGFNLNPGQVFSISNSGRFQSSGVKSVWVTWTQDNTNFYTPINNLPAYVQIL